MRLLTRGQGLVMRAAAGGLHAHKAHHLIPAHAQQWPFARMPDHRIGMIASVAHTGELFVIISYTGRTRELVEVARIARANGASVLGLTAENSPLAKASTLSLNIPLPEDTDIYMPMTSRIIQLTVLDVLATGMTLRRGVDFQPHLRKIKESLNASRYPVGDEFN